MIDIPNYGKITSKTVVFDLNGTLAVDGLVSEKIKELLKELGKTYKLVVLTADTYGTLEKEFNGLPITVDKIKNEIEKEKAAEKYSPYIGIGNGNNDCLMLEKSELGILIIGEEGASTNALLKSDIVINNIKDAINLLLNEKRIIATLRK
ncbi:HAD family hydrolase [Methanococcus maripaludis]|uniref:HAD family hydrolase n=1 Tax=Methanococcus maripaludis TaxID=39152 RepID=UPI0018C8D0CF|nr:HAD family hydrolase [Methanococcus maripaludis]